MTEGPVGRAKLKSLYPFLEHAYDPWLIQVSLAAAKSEV